MEFGPQHTPYVSIGGDDAVKALVTRFYDAMDADPAFATVRALHAADLSSAREKLYEFLTGWLGGPPLYVNKHGHPRLRGRHMPFPIGVVERDQWLACMTRSMDDGAIDGDLRRFLDERFAHVANFMRNVDAVGPGE